MAQVDSNTEPQSTFMRHRTLSKTLIIMHLPPDAALVGVCIVQMLSAWASLGFKATEFLLKCQLQNVYIVSQS